MTAGRDPASSDGLLELDGLTRRFGALTALDGLSFSVPAGRVVGFLGPNGIDFLCEQARLSAIRRVTAQRSPFLPTGTMKAPPQRGLRSRAWVGNPGL